MMSKKISVILIMLFVISLIGCEEPPLPTGKFKVGDIVVHKISGLKAQIIYDFTGYQVNHYVIRIYYPIKVYDTFLGHEKISKTGRIERLDVKEYEIEYFKEE